MYVGYVYSLEADIGCLPQFLFTSFFHTGSPIGWDLVRLARLASQHMLGILTALGE